MSNTREGRNTEAQCIAKGFMVLAFIVEARSGTFVADAKKLLRQMRQRFASSSGGNVDGKVSELAIARAVLRRWSHRLEGLPQVYQRMSFSYAPWRHDLFDLYRPGCLSAAVSVSKLFSSLLQG